MSQFNLFYINFLILIKNILIIISAFMSLPILNQIYNLIIKKRTYTETITRIKKGILTISDLHKLTPREFEHWCAEFLSKQGYTNIIVSTKGPDGGKDIVCTNGTLTYYVECKRYYYGKYPQFQVDGEICKKLIGAMEANHITSGIIMTTGHLTNDAIEYINTLPNPYCIEAYDGNALINQYESRRQNLITLTSKN